MGNGLLQIVRKRSFWAGEDPNSLSIRRDTETQMHQEEEGHVTTEAQTGVTHLQIKEHQGLRATPEAQRKAQ